MSGLVYIKKYSMTEPLLLEHIKNHNIASLPRVENDQVLFNVYILIHSTKESCCKSSQQNVYVIYVQKDKTAADYLLFNTNVSQLQTAN